jgi:hypothetical protein
VRIAWHGGGDEFLADGGDTDRGEVAALVEAVGESPVGAMRGGDRIGVPLAAT